MKQSPQKKFYLTLLWVMIVGWSIIGVWLYTDNGFFLLMMMAWVFIGALFIRAVRCPNCGEPVSFQGKLGGLKVNAAVAHVHCKNCGHDLSVPDR